MTTLTDTPVAATPARRRIRLRGIDLARSLAVLGMIAVHSLDDYDADGNPTMSYSLSAGHASAMFAVLAGVAIAFLSGRRRLPRGPQSRGTAASLVARAGMLGLIGLSLGYTEIDYGVVILPYYAVMFLLAVPLVYLGTRTLAVLAVASAALMPALSQLVRPHLPEPFTRQLSWETVLVKPIESLANLLFTGEFPVVVWMTYVLVGIVVGRLDLSSLRINAWLTGFGALLVSLSATLSWMVLHPFDGLNRLEAITDPDTLAEVLAFGSDGTVPTDTWWWLGVNGPHTGTSLDLMNTIGSSLLVLGLCLLLFRIGRPPLARAVNIVTAPLVAVGTMSLTVYVGHIMFINSDFDMYDATEGYLRQVLVICVVALAWRATAGRGPLEGLVTAVTTRVRRAVESRGGRR
ncbi:heparan-alpha-glucosaminide N-acetyltransferase domain-containing protein [Rhodococcus sp. UNC363MFTsu5.1]|uniref:heparan-alpha-glucosaminide N-acetyltransferase domain-containing protein n=1 Tax=Rhodococcus sp. UNC363MFTsu5.1 TaxID=1449069 RepID=UPI000486C171|nr:heparan-alpha-glucosaminide N-acetyltransferase domain-containing protein [Rhodococcus sp. UNC363MFTsu5.1]